MLKKQRIISKIIIGSVLICMLISPALAVDFTANILPESLVIISANPSEDFAIDTSESQVLSVTLNRAADLAWYIDGEESRTDYNSISSNYYFSSSMTGTYNVTVVCTSIPVFTQVNHSWLATVTGTSHPPVTHAIFPYSDVETPYIEYPDEVIPDGIIPDGVPDEVIPEKEGILDNVNRVIIALAILFSILLFITIFRSGNNYEALPQLKPSKQHSPQFRSPKQYSPHYRPPKR